MTGLYFAIGAGALALLFAIVLARRVTSADPGNERMREIGAAIQEGAAAFLKREYSVLAVFVLLVSAILLVLGLLRDEQQWETAVAYIVGAFASGLTGIIGMRIAVQANMRTAAARTFHWARFEWVADSRLSCATASASAIVPRPRASSPVRSSTRFWNGSLWFDQAWFEM